MITFIIAKLRLHPAKLKLLLVNLHIHGNSTKEQILPMPWDLECFTWLTETLNL